MPLSDPLSKPNQEGIVQGLRSSRLTGSTGDERFIDLEISLEESKNIPA